MKAAVRQECISDLISNSINNNYSVFIEISFCLHINRMTIDQWISPGMGEFHSPGLPLQAAILSSTRSRISK